MKFPKTTLLLIGISLLCSCATPKKEVSTINNLTKKEAHPTIKIPPEEKPKIKTIEKKVIAVMKFENLSKNPKFDWLCEGIASTLVSKLGNVKKVRLVERSQVVKSLQEINFNMSGVVDEKTAVSAGKILGAEIMVIGEFQKSADQMRITARFVDVATGNIVNTAEATGRYNDIFSLQDEIVFNLLKTLGIEIKIAEQKKIQKKPTVSLTAYGWAKKAIELWFKKKEKIATEKDQNLIIKYFKKALELDPNYAEVHVLLGVVYGEKDLYDQAIEEFKEAIRIKPDHAYAYFKLALAYHEKGLYDEAIEAYKEATKFNPDDAEAHRNLGLVYARKGLYDEAIEEFKETIRIKPDHAEAHSDLGVAYDMQGLRNEAIKGYIKAIKIKPDYARAHLNLGSAYLDKGLYDQAIEECKEAIRINPDYAGAHLNLGRTYTKKGLYDQAIEEYKEAIRIQPDFVHAHFDLGVIYVDKGLYDEAIEEFKKTIRIKPDYADAHLNLGLVYFGLGRRGEALDEYKILKELDKELANKLFNLIYK